MHPLWRKRAIRIAKRKGDTPFLGATAPDRSCSPKVGAIQTIGQTLLLHAL